MTTYPIELETLDGREIHFVKLAGELSVPALLAFMAQLNTLAGQRASVDLLVDESEAKATLISPLDLRKLAQAWNDSIASERTRVAVIAPTPVIYGLNRMAHAFAKSENRLKVFKSRADAAAWLVAES